MISSSSRNGRPRSVEPILPYAASRRVNPRFMMGSVVTYHCPKHALQLQDQILVFTFQTMSSDELRKLREVALLFQHSAPKLGLRHDAVEVWRYDRLRPRATLHMRDQLHKEDGNTHVLFVCIRRCNAKRLGKEDLDVNDVM